MMVSGVFGVLVSGVLLLVTTTTTLVQPTGASTATTSATPTSNATGTSDVTTTDESSSSGILPDDAIEACSPAVADCEGDQTCFSCMRTDSTSSTEALACFEAAGIDGIESSTASCSPIAAAVCCFDQVSEFECLENEHFVNYWTCFLEAEGCSGEDLTCDDEANIDGGVHNDGVVNGDGANDVNDDVDVDVDSKEGATSGTTTATARDVWTLVTISYVFMISLKLLRA